MTLKLFFQAMGKITLGIILVGTLIFLPAGTIYFPNGWLLMAILFVPMFVAGIAMMLKCPERLKRRLNAKETKKEQSLIIKFSALMFIVGFVLAGLDFRFGWSSVPDGIVIAAAIIFIMAYLFYAEVVYENAYLSRTIEVQEGQRVVDTGLYAIMRHPMYTATVFLFLTMPIILGSIWSFAVFLAYPFIIAGRIKFEEEFLEKELSGYREYKQKVKYRLIPFVW